MGLGPGRSSLSEGSWQHALLLPGLLGAGNAVPGAEVSWEFGEVDMEWPFFLLIHLFIFIYLFIYSFIFVFVLFFFFRQLFFFPASFSCAGLGFLEGPPMRCQECFGLRFPCSLLAQASFLFLV